MDNIRIVVARITTRWIFTIALILLTLSQIGATATIFSLSQTAARNRKVNQENHELLVIVKAATGCDESQSVDQCKALLAHTQQSTGQAFIERIDRITVAAIECHHELLITVSDADFENCVRSKSSV